MGKPQLHYVFQGHPRGQKRPKLKHGIKTLVVEVPTGFEAGENYLENGKNMVPKTPSQSKFKERVLKLAAKGVRIVPGETGSKEEIARLHELDTDQFVKSVPLLHGPSLQQIKDFFKSFAEFERARNDMASRTISREMGKGKLQVEYGTAHSAISWKPKRSRVPLTREMKPIAFGPSEIVIRKLELGKEPTSKEYWAASITTANENRLAEGICAKPLDRLNDADVRFAKLVEKELLTPLTELELTRISYGNIHSMFELHGLQSPLKRHANQKAIKQEIAVFLEKKSIFWQRLPEKEKRKMIG